MPRDSLPCGLVTLTQGTGKDEIDKKSLKKLKKKITMRAPGNNVIKKKMQG